MVKQVMSLIFAEMMAPLAFGETMKSKMKTLILASLVTLGMTSSAFASDSVCRAYADASDAELRVIKTVHPETGRLSKVDMGMIQAAVVSQNPESPMTPEEAVQVFTDEENGGSNGGSLVYSELTVGTRKHTVVRVTWYPGDNEYGTLFEYWKTQSGQPSVTKIGEIHDSDVLCLE